MIWKPSREIIRPSRRSFLTGAVGGLIAAPAIVRAGSLSLMGAGKPPSGGGGGSPAKVQGNLIQSGAASSTTVAVTLPSPVQAGNLVVGTVGFAGNYGSLTVSDNQGNSYTLVDEDSGSYSWVSFYRANVQSGPQTITATIDGSHTFRTLIVTEFTNILATSPLDANSINIAQSGVNTTNGITSGSDTTTVNGDLVWGSCVNLSGSSSLTKGTAFTQDQVSGQDFNTEYLIQATAGSIAATWTGTTSDTFTSVMMAFKAA